MGTDKLSEDLERHAPAAWRVDTWDRKIYALAASGHEYGDLYCLNATVLDVGAHIGGFTHYALRNGARRIVAIEPWRANYRLLRDNIAALHPVQDADVTLVHGAIWSSEGKISFSPHPGENTGGGTTDPRHEGEAVDAYTLDTWLEDLEHVDVLKMDCEGAELPSLWHCEQLHRVDTIVGEYHRQSDPGARTPEEMLGRLALRGFVVTAEEKTAALGKFVARRVER